MLKWTRQKDAGKGAGAAPVKAGSHPGRVLRQAPHGSPADAAPARPESLSQLLLQEGRATQTQMDVALAKQRETGAFLGEILIEEQVLDEQSLISFLAKQCKIPHLSLLDYLIDPEILKLVPAETCLKHRLLPIDKLGRNLTLAMVNPLDRAALEAVKKVCPDLRIKPILCAYKHFDIVTKRLYAEQKDEGRSSLSATSLGLRAAPKVSAPAPAEPEDAPPAPVVDAEDERPDTAEAPAETDAPEPDDTLLDVHVDDLAIEDDMVDEEPAPPPPLPKPPPPPPPLPIGLPDDEGTVARDALIDNVFSEKGEKPADGSSTLMDDVTNVMVDSMRDTYAILARRMELFRGVGPEDVAKLFARGITAEYETGQVIFQAGDPGDQLYVILGGEVLIHDEDREIARLNRGDMFGEMALVEHAPRSASAKVISDASLLALSWDVINHVMPPEVSLKLLVNIVITMSERLRRANQQ